MVGSTVAERLSAGPVPLWLHPGWEERFPWLVQGTTGLGDPEDPFDLGLAGSAPVGRVLERWRALGRAAGTPRLVHALQVHRTELWVHTGGGAPGLQILEGADGHLTDRPGILLTVSVADCVPVSLVDPRRRVVALLHAGWRGAAAGILEGALERLRAEFHAQPRELWLHCGPAICGACYEVGPEVHRALRPASSPPPAAAPLDLRAVLAERAAAAGILPERITLSAHCTRCTPDAFFSHRGGSPARQMGVLGLRG